VIGKANIDPSGDFRVEWAVPPSRMDQLWADGWRHFGPFFFRRYYLEYGEEIKSVQPLRIALRHFRLSKSQRRVLRRNVDLELQIRPTIVDEPMRRVFSAHLLRFTHNTPSCLEDFLGFQPSSVPCQNMTLAVLSSGRLVAASFLDLGQDAVSSVYGIFDPVESRRSLGIFTMLKEIEYAQQRGCEYYYPGYACIEPSPYDYKKQFAGLEHYDWAGGWTTLF
jgi:arginine-tRNA-protein transferase